MDLLIRYGDALACDRLCDVRNEGIASAGAASLTGKGPGPGQHPHLLPRPPPWPRSRPRPNRLDVTSVRL
jgi:hypothetical protein